MACLCKDFTSKMEDINRKLLEKIAFISKDFKAKIEEILRKNNPN